jgi:hypothetical protein
MVAIRVFASFIRLFLQTLVFCLLYQRGRSGTCGLIDSNGDFFPNGNEVNLNASCTLQNEIEIVKEGDHSVTGSAPYTTVTAAANKRHFKLDDPTSELTAKRLTLKFLKLQGGDVSAGADAAGYGGSVYLGLSSILIAEACWFYNNTATAGGSIYQSNVYNGFEDSTDSNMETFFDLSQDFVIFLTNTNITYSAANGGSDGNGGAVNGKNIYLRNVTIAENTATAKGGGVYFQRIGGDEGAGATALEKLHVPKPETQCLMLIDSTFQNNQQRDPSNTITGGTEALGGGALYIDNAGEHMIYPCTIRFQNSVFVTNQAETNQGHMIYENEEVELRPYQIVTLKAGIKPLSAHNNFWKRNVLFGMSIDSKHMAWTEADPTGGCPTGYGTNVYVGGKKNICNFEQHFLEDIPELLPPKPCNEGQFCGIKKARGVPTVGGATIFKGYHLSATNGASYEIVQINSPSWGSITYQDSTQITANVPAGTGKDHVLILKMNGVAPTIKSKFSYKPPRITSVQQPDEYGMIRLDVDDLGNNVSNIQVNIFNPGETTCGVPCVSVHPPPSPPLGGIYLCIYSGGAGNPPGTVKDIFITVDGQDSNPFPLTWVAVGKVTGIPAGRQVVAEMGQVSYRIGLTKDLARTEHVTVAISTQTTNGFSCTADPTTVSIFVSFRSPRSCSSRAFANHAPNSPRSIHFIPLKQTRTPMKRTSLSLPTAT